MKKLLGILKKAGIAFVSEGKTYDLLHTEGSFGEIGEGYMFLWYLFADNTYRAKQ